MSIQVILFHLSVICLMLVFGSIGHSGGIAVEIILLCTNLIAGILATIIGALLCSFGNFDLTNGILLPLFIFAIAVPLNALLKSLMVSQNIKSRLHEKKPLFYTIGGVLGSIRGFLIAVLITVSMSICNNSNFLQEINNCKVYQLLNSSGILFYKMIHSFYKTENINLNKSYDKINNEEITNNNESKKIEEVKSHLLSCQIKVMKVHEYIRKAPKIKIETAHRLITISEKLNCDSFIRLYIKFSDLHKGKKLNKKIVCYLITKEVTDNLKKSNITLDNEEFILVSNSALSYMRNISSENIIYHSILKHLSSSQSQQKNSVNTVKEKAISAQVANMNHQKFETKSNTNSKVTLEEKSPELTTKSKSL